MKLNIIGWYNEKNAGDEAFREVFKQYLPEHEKTFGYAFDPKSDVTIFGGGGVMQGGYFNNLKLGHPLYALGVDIPLSGPHYEKLLRLKFQEIHTRSEEYSGLAHAQGMRNVQYCPDLAFGLEVPPQILMATDPDIIQCFRESKREKLGILLTSELQPRQFSEMKRALLGFQKQYDLVFICMYRGKGMVDEVVHQAVSWDLDRNRLWNINRTSDPKMLLSLISQMHAVITMRFHGAIFATIANVPFVSLANSGKHSLFCEQERIKDHWVDLREFNHCKLMAQTTWMLGEPRDGMVEKLKRISDRNREQVRMLFERARQTWLA
jgi:hypothetical protein